MLQWIAQYWLGVLFGAIVGVAALFHKRIGAWYKVYKEKQIELLRAGINEELQGMMTGFIQRSDENDERIYEQIKSLKLQIGEVREGLLNVQGDHFISKCRNYLQSSEPITLDAFEELEQNHAAYNNLGGNHHGDALFELVKKKYEDQLST